MASQPRIAVYILGSCLALNSALAQTSSSSTSTTNQKEASMTKHASGPFDVKLSPLTPYNQDDATLGRFSLDKQYHGELEGTSKGEMLGSGSGAKGSSGGYVAIETVTGTLNGRRGTFVLQHSSTMTRGTPHQQINVVPDSGTGQLTGLTGKMNIIIASGGKHSYDFEYTLPAEGDKQ
jgi:hypothetical protein